MSDAEVTKPAQHFIRQIVAEDNKTNKWDGRVVTRFPPEPNGHLHIGHAKSICLNFTIAKENSGGKCHLRFDDTNPIKEDQKFVASIRDDIKWLGFEWGENIFFASDYFEKLYRHAQELIKKGKAYVCQLTPEQIREYRGSLDSPGKDSPFRKRSMEENLDLFTRMRAGDFADGEYTLRALIDMSSPNINMRDPIIYRIRKAPHHKTGNDWPIYPMYDYTHCLCDSFEKITHSLCSLEFEDHRPLYNWFLEELGLYHPVQTEFARLNLEYTIMSKRMLLQLVEEKYVQGWDDPRMPTIKGMRRRGYLPQSILDFCEQIGVTKKDTTITLITLETIVRDHLNSITPRVFGVIRPLKVVIENYEEEEKLIECKYHPKDESLGTRAVPFSKELYIEQDDFMQDPPKKFFRLGPGRNVRLKYGYIITCNEVVKNQSGEIVELKCSYHKDSLGGVTPEGMKKVKGIINWVSAKHSIPAEVRLYERLFNVANPLKDKEVAFIQHLNTKSLEVVTAQVEPSLKEATVGQRFQFERQGYFIIDSDSNSQSLIFNRTETLRDSWAKQ